VRLLSDEALATLTIWTEAQGESFEGKVAVGEVIRERMRRKYASDGTVAGTVARRYQFSAWNDDHQDNTLLIRALKLDWGDVGIPECQRAWEKSATTNYVSKAVLYCNLAVAQPDWAKPEKLVAKIEHHSFFSD
jgi:spore germination cell wall hydrolase CwlJ-like protein